MTLTGLIAAVAERQPEPFPHLMIDGVLAGGLADDILAWMETTTSWVPRQERFYRSDNIHFSPANVPAELAPLLSAGSRRDLRLALEDHFRHRFQPVVQVSANRYRPGQGTLIHTDFVPSHIERDPFFFTHRFLIYFLRGWDVGRGGALGLFSTSDPASLAKTIEPIHNRGVGLVIGPRSYHAVAAVNDGERYTVNICLRSVTGEYDTGAPSPWH